MLWAVIKRSRSTDESIDAAREIIGDFGEWLDNTGVNDADSIFVLSEARSLLTEGDIAGIIKLTPTAGLGAGDVSTGVPGINSIGTEKSNEEQNKELELAFTEGRAHRSNETYNVEGVSVIRFDVEGLSDSHIGFYNGQPTICLAKEADLEHEKLEMARHIQEIRKRDLSPEDRNDVESYYAQLTQDKAQDIHNQARIIDSLRKAGLSESAIRQITQNVDMANKGEAFKDMVFTLEIGGIEHAISVKKGESVKQAVLSYLETSDKIKEEMREKLIGVVSEVMEDRYEYACTIGQNGELKEAFVTAGMIFDADEEGFRMKSKVKVDLNSDTWIIHSHPKASTDEEFEDRFKADMDNVEALRGMGCNIGSLVIEPNGNVRVLSMPAAPSVTVPAATIIITYTHKVEQGRFIEEIKLGVSEDVDKDSADCIREMLKDILGRQPLRPTVELPIASHMPLAPETRGKDIPLPTMPVERRLNDLAAPILALFFDSEDVIKAQAILESGMTAEEKVFGLAELLKQAGIFRGQYAAVVDLREKEGFDRETMKNALNALATKDIPVKIYVILGEGETAKGIDLDARSIIRVSDTENVLEAVAEKIQTDMEGISNGNISIALTENEKNVNDITAHFERHEARSLNVLIANKKEVYTEQQSIPALDLLNLLSKLTAADTVSVMAINCNQETIESMRSMLKGIMRLIVIKAKDIGEEIRNFINTIRETARSL